MSCMQASMADPPHKVARSACCGPLSGKVACGSPANVEVHGHVQRSMSVIAVVIADEILPMAADWARLHYSRVPARSNTTLIPPCQYSQHLRCDHKDKREVNVARMAQVDAAHAEGRHITTSQSVTAGVAALATGDRRAS